MYVVWYTFDMTDDMTIYIYALLSIRSLHLTGLNTELRTV